MAVFQFLLMLSGILVQADMPYNGLELDPMFPSSPPKDLDHEISCSQKEMESMKPETGVTIGFFPNEDPLNEGGYTLVSCPACCFVVGPTFAICSKNGWTPKKLGYCTPVSMSCGQTIPRMQDVSGIQYNTDAPWTHEGGNAFIHCARPERNITAECQDGKWKFHHCKNNFSLLIGGEESGSSLEWFTFNPLESIGNGVLTETHLSPARSGHVSAVLDDGRVLIAGGFETKAQPLSTVELYDPVRETWSNAPDMSIPRLWPAAANVNGAIYVCGGRREYNHYTLNSCERFQSGDWENITPMSEKRRGLAMVAFNGTLEVQREDLNDCEQYDVEGNKWTAFPPMEKKRNGLSLVVVGGRLLALGGRGSNGSSTTVEFYMPKDRYWIVPNKKLSKGRYRHSTVVI